MLFDRHYTVCDR